MTAFSKYSLLFIFFLHFTGCRENLDQNNIENAVNKLVEKYPQLNSGKTRPIEFFKLVRSVTVGETNIQIQLRTAPWQTSDPQSVLLFINSKEEVIAIPFLSNSYKDYWQFPYEKPITTIEPVNTTFEEELNNAFEVLKINDSIGIYLKVIDELLISVLHCRQLFEYDSINFYNKSVPSSTKTKLPDDHPDSCILRVERNFKEIYKEFYPNGKKSELSTGNFNAFEDHENYRIYQFSYPRNHNYSAGYKGGRIYYDKGAKIKFKLKTYRQDCSFTPID